MRMQLLAAAAVSALMLAGCAQPPSLVTKDYESRAQNVRAVNRLQAEDIAVAQVRVSKDVDLWCAGRTIPIPGAENGRTDKDNFARYWQRAFESELAQAGVLNQENPKVKLYNLIESVRIVAEPTRIQWMLDMNYFSSNGTIFRDEVVYNVPTDSLKNMQEGCERLAEGLDKAVSWSILKVLSSPSFAPLVEPGLSYEPKMTSESLAHSLTTIVKPEEEEEIWKAMPNKRF